jgi:hypothetical protein
MSWTLILVFFLGLGAGFMTTAAVLSLILGIKSRRWSAVEGEILSSEVIEWLSEPGSAGEFYDRGGAKCYAPEIFYKYTIKNSDYYSNRIDAREVTGGDQGIKRSLRFVNKYYPGKKVSIYYDPNNPERSVLESGITLGAVFYIEAVTGFVALPGCMYWWASLQPSIVVPWIVFVIGVCLGVPSAYFLSRAIEKDR